MEGLGCPKVFLGLVYDDTTVESKTNLHRGRLENASCSWILGWIFVRYAIVMGYLVALFHDTGPLIITTAISFCM